jgi:hypothetical protein
MNIANNGATGYKVIPVETVKADLRRFHKELMEQGEGEAFLAALRQITARLRTDPHAFGESKFRLPALNLTVYQGIIRPLAVTYGIHEQRPLVIIRVVKLLPKHTK